MGNWRTVWILGKIPKEDVEEMREFFTPKSDYSNFNCLINTEGLCGVGQWVQHKPNAVGNLAERGYTPDDVMEVMKTIGEKWPSVELTIHCGDDYEKSNVVATLKLKDGKVEKCDPEVDELPEISEEMMKGRLSDAIFGKPMRKELSRCKQCHTAEGETEDFEISGMTMKVSTNHQTAERIREYQEEGHKFRATMCSECGVITEVKRS